ncbi:hypothetical protein Pmar_PMAR000648, partial [Perkinsus marinus ATCC 50983]
SAGMLCRTLGSFLISFVASGLGALLDHRTVIAITSVIPLCSALVVVVHRNDVETNEEITFESAPHCCAFHASEI